MTRLAVFATDAVTWEGGGSEGGCEGGCEEMTKTAGETEHHDGACKRGGPLVLGGGGIRRGGGGGWLRRWFSPAPVFLMVIVASSLYR